jgi:hypothetical protein
MKHTKLLFFLRVQNSFPTFLNHVSSRCLHWLEINIYGLTPHTLLIKISQILVIRATNLGMRQWSKKSDFKVRCLYLVVYTWNSYMEMDFFLHCRSGPSDLSDCFTRLRWDNMVWPVGCHKYTVYCYKISRLHFSHWNLIIRRFVLKWMGTVHWSQKTRKLEDFWRRLIIDLRFHTPTSF